MLQSGEAPPSFRQPPISPTPLCAPGVLRRCALTPPSTSTRRCEPIDAQTTVPVSANLRRPGSLADARSLTPPLALRFRSTHSFRTRPSVCVYVDQVLHVGSFGRSASVVFVLTGLTNCDSVTLTVCDKDIDIGWLKYIPPYPFSRRGRPRHKHTTHTQYSRILRCPTSV